MLLPMVKALSINGLMIATGGLLSSSVKGNGLTAGLASAGLISKTTAGETLTLPLWQSAWLT
jgi:hypothetical protein